MVVGADPLARTLVPQPDPALCFVLGDAAEPMIIDWPDACRGDPAADVCRSYLLLTLHASELAAPYLDAYCRRAETSRQAIFDWLPYIAAARLAEIVPGEADRLSEILWLNGKP